LSTGSRDDADAEALAAVFAGRGDGAEEDEEAGRLPRLEGEGDTPC
jgi:hypothetical protein